MKLLGKIVSIIVILAGLATLFFTYQLKNQRQVLREEKATLTASLTATTNALLKTEADLRDTVVLLTTATNKLLAVETALDATNKVLVTTIGERDKLTADLAAATQQLQTANTELVSSKEALTKAQETIAAQAAEIAKIEDFKKQIQVLTQENKTLGENLQVDRANIKRLLEENDDLRKTPVTTRGQIAAVENRWSFVILDVGQNQKVRQNTEFLVYRNKKFICKVFTVSVSPNTAVAQILPEFQKGDPRPGDTVIH
jgi:chromosome segregation ATPase